MSEAATTANANDTPRAPSARRSRPRAGFTLVEVLAAGVILAAFAAVLSMSVSHTMASLTRAEEDVLAAQYLDEVLTRIDLLGPERMLREGPMGGVLDERFSWAAEIRPRLTGSLYEIGVRIEWSTQGGTRSVEGHTLLNDPWGSRDPRLQWEDL